jgi:anti-sigma regulatory factor (Ser/Thr protein kinase)
MDVIFPRRLERQSIFGLLATLDSTRDVDSVTLDFSQLRYSLPIAMLVAGSKVREWKLYRSARGYECRYRGVDSGIQAHSYLMHLGFFDFIGVPHGNQVGQARGSARYLPITRAIRPAVDVRDVGLDAWYGAIESEARRLAGVLAGSHDDTEELRTYTYCIREIIRNVFEHSGADECFICGQRWQHGVEIALIDEGVGIGATLNEGSGDADALLQSIRPGVSRTSQHDNTENIYDNSGFGLFVLSELAASFGWFVLGSGVAQLVGHQKLRDVEASSFRGTYFGMRLLAAPNDFRSVLADIIQAGEEEARLTGTHARASGRSRLVLIEE